MKQMFYHSFATYRLVRLFQDDEISAELREAIYIRLGRVAQDHPKAAPAIEKVVYLLGCPWCLSVWFGAALLLVRKASPAAYEALCLILISSLASGIIASNAYRLGIEE